MEPSKLSEYIDQHRNDVSKFNPSGAIYFMDGYSDATLIIKKSGERLHFKFWDRNTSISATAPMLYNKKELEKGIYIPVPPPLEATAFLPNNTPDRYKQDTTMHLMQVISMNMLDKDTECKLLIGVPYAEQFPEIFYDSSLFEDASKDASSYGIVQSLTQFVNPVTKKKEVDSNGYPARSMFGIYHIIETHAGTFFNKRATQMELQPGNDGKLARNLPPIPFNYNLINGPIELFDVKDPKGPPVADLVAAHHNDAGPATLVNDAWPYRRIDVDGIDRVKNRKRKS